MTRPPRRLLLVPILLAGCHHYEAVRFVAPDFAAQAPAKVVVLPFDNHSTDLVGPELLRGMVAQSLREHGYEPAPVQEVDEKLRTIGVTDGGQLRAIKADVLNKALEADGLVYGVVEEFAFLNVGFAVRRVVRLHLRFVRASSGATLWEDTGQGLTEWFTFNRKDAERAFMEGVVQRAAELAFRTPLMPESNEAVRQLFLRLPRKSAVRAG
ncbi:MAG: DUF799 family lipoprotein [Elusimicrobia bacterium]|nr:DUF799 family lipoprotein [Elusimicrobiota bacterium]